MNWLLALLLLVPGLLFLFIVVFYIAFIGKAPRAVEPAHVVCLECGHTLMPDETSCPKCGTQIDQPHASSQPPDSTRQT
jgi:ribosomal protein L40E